MGNKVSTDDGLTYSLLRVRFGCRPLPRARKRCQGQERQHNRALKKVIILKNEARQAMRSNMEKEEIQSRCGKFLSLLREHSRLKRVSDHKGKELEAKEVRKQCHENFWCFTRELLDGDVVSDIPPAFSAQTAQKFFSEQFSSQPHEFSQPTWMPATEDPKYEMPHLDPITREELLAKIKRSKFSSAPSPLDQIYRIFKNCPSLIPALLNLYNSVLSEGVVPSSWKNAVFKLLGKSAASDDPHPPSNFRPIALTPAVSKLFSGILKDRWLVHMTSNGYLDADVQKAFLPTIPGVSEHHSKLAAIINGARKAKRSLAVAWLDIVNAYGSIHHSLIQFTLQRLHAPTGLCNLLLSWYDGISASISTSNWVSPSIPLEIGVYQGDPLSVLIFLTVIATLSDTLSTKKDLGVKISSSEPCVNHLLYADDTCITANSPAACQHLLYVVQQWLDWAKLKVNPSKSRVLCLKASTGRAFTPELSIGGESIDHIGTSSFKFLGIQIQVPPNPLTARNDLKHSVEQMLRAIDAVPVTSHQKLRLYK